jgi:hypothetical protein
LWELFRRGGEEIWETEGGFFSIQANIQQNPSVFS